MARQYEMVEIKNSLVRGTSISDLKHLKNVIFQNVISVIHLSNPRMHQAYISQYGIL